MGIFDNFNLMHGPRNLLKIEKKTYKQVCSTIVTSTVMHVVFSRYIMSNYKAHMHTFTCLNFEIM